MSIVDSAGLHVHLDPRPARSVVDVKSPRIQKRNRHWLGTKRLLDLTTRELAQFVKQPHTTVVDGVRWAEEEEQGAFQRAESFEGSPVLDEDSGLTVDDVVHLMAKYPPESELGSHPAFRAILDPLAARLDAFDAGAGELVSDRAA